MSDRGGRLKRGARTAGLTIAAAALVATLSGACVISEPTPEMTAPDYSGVLSAFLENTSAQTSVASWLSSSTSMQTELCPRGFGKEGRAAVFELYSRAGGDASADLENVAAYWKTLGMRLRLADREGRKVSRGSTSATTVIGEGGPVATARFEAEAAEGGYAITATSTCLPAGDPVFAD